MPNTDATTHTLDVPGARLHYEVRGSGPLLLMIGAPMDSQGFASLAPFLSDDYTLVTYDPRGISRSTRDDPTQDDTPELLADDVYRLVSALGSGPVHLLGNSGGAVTGLELVTRHPGLVGTLIAHEPMLAELLSDAARVRAGIDEMSHLYATHGSAAAWAKFLALNGIASPDPGTFERDEAAEGEPAAPAVDGRPNDEVFFAHMIRPFSRYLPDIAALLSSSTRIVVGRGATSTGQLPNRTAAALATELGVDVVDFPGGHGGFAEDPAQFALLVRRILAE